MTEVNYYIDQLPLPHIEEVKTITLTKSKYTLFRQALDKIENLTGYRIGKGDEKYRGFRVVSEEIQPQEKEKF